MNKKQVERTIGLLGENFTEIIKDKTIAVVGLGGVGGTALESLARTGFENFLICDCDEVSESNLNRQILYTQADIGKRKTKIAKERIVTINKDAKICEIDSKLNADNIAKFSEYKIDFIVDAIDDVNAKIVLAKYAFKNNIPLIVSLGMANRLNPADVQVIRLDKTTNDPLARKFRYELKKEGVDTTKIMTVCSKENPIKDEGKLHSIMTVPSSAGLNITYHVIKYFLEGEK